MKAFPLFKFIFSRAGEFGLMVDALKTVFNSVSKYFTFNSFLAILGCVPKLAEVNGKAFADLWHFSCALAAERCLS